MPLESSKSDNRFNGNNSAPGQYSEISYQRSTINITKLMERKSDFKYQPQMAQDRSYFRNGDGRAARR